MCTYLLNNIFFVYICSVSDKKWCCFSIVWFAPVSFRMTDRPNICTPSAQYSNIKFENTGSLENVSQSSHTPDTTQTTNEISPAKVSYKTN